MKRDYLSTFVVTGATLLSYLLTFRLVARHFGVDSFGVYALTRRTISVLAPLAVLGADYATARSVALATGHGRRTDTYLPVALVVMLSGVTVVSGVLLVFGDVFSRLFFGSGHYTEQVLILPLLLLGIGLHNLAYNCLRGHSRILRANLLLFVNHGAIPVGAVFVGGSVTRVLVATGAGWTLISVVSVARTPMSLSGFGSHTREILRYGVPRAPGDLVQLGLFAAPGVVAAHLADIRIAGLVAFGTSALSMVGTAVTPIAFVLLPVSARMLAGGEVAALRHHVVRVLRVVIAAVAAGTVLLELVAARAIDLYLGSAFEGSTYIVRLLALAAVPYAAYFALKSVVDARHVRAINTRSMLIAAASFAVVAFPLVAFSNSIAALLAAFVLSMYVLGSLTALEAARVLRGSPMRVGSPLAQEAPDGF